MDHAMDRSPLLTPTPDSNLAGWYRSGGEHTHTLPSPDSTLCQTRHSRAPGTSCTPMHRLRPVSPLHLQRARSPNMQETACARRCSCVLGLGVCVSSGRARGIEPKRLVFRVGQPPPMSGVHAGGSPSRPRCQWWRRQRTVAPLTCRRPARRRSRAPPRPTRPPQGSPSAWAAAASPWPMGRRCRRAPAP